MSAGNVADACLRSLLETLIRIPSSEAAAAAARLAVHI
eukprot:CAMPEP_0206608810 /NCGR_PEP_ID=MMETSP0325_2-20121206/53307_1 /ASSEMBLY_ACC=CAM_ASM_000347 /TAXON_ID=2866 /ORGANISM="Crypthecodinium cohnii, Strain Seligo" /LENGTH=37 /DNA_ID= /DNA_START= /DNA_END= /DNA_ORIENTATION=